MSADSLILEKTMVGDEQLAITYARMGYDEKKGMRMRTRKERGERKEKMQVELRVGEQLRACCVMIDICSKYPHSYSLWTFLHPVTQGLEDNTALHAYPHCPDCFNGRRRMC
jgi:hypothetical protein